MAKQLSKLIVPGNPTKPWQSSGIAKHPAFCNQCQYRTSGVGFVADSYHTGAKCALVFGYPSSDDVLEQRPLSGAMGWWIFNTFIKGSFGWDELVISHMLRCKPPRQGKDILYPIGELRKHAEKTCRKYDAQHGDKGKLVTGGLSTFEPDIIVLTFDPKDCHTVPAYHRQILSDVAKAKRFMELGYRPQICFGSEAAEFYAPFIKNNGGLKAWRGHWFNNTKEGLLVTDQKRELPLLKF